MFLSDMKNGPALSLSINEARFLTDIAEDKLLKMYRFIKEKFRPPKRCYFITKFGHGSRLLEELLILTKNLKLI